MIDKHLVLIVRCAGDDDVVAAVNFGRAREVRQFYRQWTQDMPDELSAMVASGVRTAYGAKRYERLVALKNKYDPSNLFRLNQNIKPAL